MNKTYRDVVAFVNVAHPWMEAHPRDTKLRYALKKVSAQCMKLLDAQNERAADLDVEHCAVGKDDIILKDVNGQLQFTKESLKKRNTELRALRAESLDITPFLVKIVPEDLSGTERDAFAGFVLPEDTEPVDQEIP